MSKEINKAISIKNKIFPLSEEGRSVKEIQKILGYTRGMVLESLRSIFFPDGINESVTEANIRVEHLLRDKKIENYKNQITELVDEGKNISQIAKAIKSDRAFVEAALKKILIHDDSGLSSNDIKSEIAQILKEKQNLIKESNKKNASEKKHIDFMNKHRNVVVMHNEGKTLEEIGQTKGVTRERIRQILKRNKMHGPYDDLEIIDKDKHLAKKRELNAAKRKQYLVNLTNKNEERLIKLYKSGANNKEIKDEVNFANIMIKRQTITGSTLRPQPSTKKTEYVNSLFKNAWEYLDKGKIKPIIQREFLLSDASEAHKALEKGDHVGKFIMKVS